MKAKMVLRVVEVLMVVMALGVLVGWGLKTARQGRGGPVNEYDIRSEGMLRVGDLAPDVELHGLDGQGPQRISELYRDMPLVLVFGSYT